ncbi:MAG: response regulator [Rubrobacteraceae bacterium]
MKVLTAEDDSITRKIVNRTVEKLGHEVVSAANGVEAWEKFQGDEEIKVVISDWMLPGIDGPELCRRVRRADRSDYTFFIFLTSRGDREHLMEGDLPPES